MDIRNRLYIYLRKGMQNMDFEIGQLIKLKKKHPCGSDTWEVMRVGADFRLKCSGCGHQIMIPRTTVEKSISKKKSK